ncbi:MAG: flavodoxin [Paludibacteraceae bacterium]
MRKTGLFYSYSTIKTAQIAKKILKEFTEDEIYPVNLDEAWDNEFNNYDNFILGTSTWFDGELPDHWDEMIPEINTMNFEGKKVAVYGLGNQKDYPDNFVDGIGLLAAVFENKGAEIVGYTSTEEYEFASSKAQRGNQFCGLAIDVENQNKKTNERIKAWVEQLKKEFN